MNIAYNYIILTNLLYLFCLPIAVYKRIIPAIMGILGIFVFSSEFHICYAPLQILSNVEYTYEYLCLIENMRVYGIITMFLDMFFATFNSYIIFVYLLMVKRGVVYRYTIMTLGLLVFAMIGCFVGFIPDPTRKFDNIFMMTKYMSAHSLNHTIPLDDKIESMMDTLAKTEKSNFLTFFSLIYTGTISLYFAYGYIYCRFESNFNKKDFNKKLDAAHYAYIITYRFYKKRFNLFFLVPSIAIGLFGLFVWLVLEGVFNYYLLTHGFWHICTATSYFLFLIAINPKEFGIK